MEARFEMRGVSCAYRSLAAAGAEGTPAFVNLAVRFRTDLPPRALRTALRHIEAQQGRIRVADRNAPRPLDLDVVWGNSAFFAHGFPVPGPSIFEPPYVAMPCAELWPDLVVPELGRPLGELVAALDAEGRRGMQPIDLG